MNRRDFLKRTATATIAACAAPGRANTALAATRVIDTHTHFYDPARTQGVPWPAKGSPLYRTVLPQDWRLVAQPLGITETIVVEASSWLEDNAWVLDLAAAERSIVGFVGHLLPHEVDFEAHLRRFAGNPLFRGIRVSGGDFAGHFDKPEFRRGLRLLADLGLELDVNGPPALLPFVAKIATEVPALRMVINHAGGAGDPARLAETWLTGMKEAARQQNVFCKVSGLIEQTERSRQEWGQAPRETAYYTPILDHCWECFGEERLIYGSNWPVCEKGGSYRDQFKIVFDYFSAKSPEACERYFWKNARAVYQCLDRSA